MQVSREGFRHSLERATSDNLSQASRNRVTVETSRPSRFDAQLLSTADVCDLLVISRATFYRLRSSDPSFPAPLYVTERLPRWRSDEIREWLSLRQRQPLQVRPALLRGGVKRGPTVRRLSEIARG
ncbi:MAG: helix-turn-helix transcriptional regulator [Acidimicrobiia bacterium]